MTALRLPPGSNEHAVRALVDQPGLRGVVLEAYGAGNGPTDAWCLDPLRAAVERGVVVVVTTQCRAGSVHGGLYATGADRRVTGAVLRRRHDLRRPCAPSCIVLADRPAPDQLRAQCQKTHVAGELSV